MSKLLYEKVCQISTPIALFVFELSQIFGKGGGVKRPPPGQARVKADISDAALQMQSCISNHLIGKLRSNDDVIRAIHISSYNFLLE